MEDFKRTDFGYSVGWYIVATVVESVLVAHILFQDQMPSQIFILVAYAFIVLLVGSSVTWLAKASMAIFKIYNPKAVKYVIVCFLGIKIALVVYLVGLLKGLV